MGDGNSREKMICDWEEAGQAISRQLPQWGAEIVNEARKFLSVRELARRTGLSPTYLSMVGTKKTVISTGAYLRICRILEREKLDRHCQDAAKQVAEWPEWKRKVLG